MITSLLALFASSALSVANPMDGIRQVLCGDPKTHALWTGTMVHVAPHTYLTANHVAQFDSVCFDVATHQQLVVSYNDPTNDFAMISAVKELDNVIFKVSCEPFKTGKDYYSIGYPDSFPVVIKVKATPTYTNQYFKVEGKNWYHMRQMRGPILHGMSGGPMFDKNFVIHGINNAANNVWSWSRELADTQLCK